MTVATTPLSQPAPPPDEAERQARLDRMKRIATGLLLGAVVVFVVARALESRFPWLAAVRATAEAAMIGGLADWFAVTALFRHPMGIPIPHTAIIPARKDQVGKSLGGFVQRNFLTREVIAAKLAQARVAEHLAAWLADPDNARTLARRAATALASAAHALRDEDVQAMIDRTIAERVRRTQVAPLLGKALTVVTAGNRHQELLDGAITLTARMVTEHRGAIREKIGDESPWWIPGVVDEKIYKKVVASIEQTLQDVRDDPGHPLRERFDDVLRDFIVKLQTSPQVIERAEQLKEEMLNAEVVRRFSGSLWTDAKSALLKYAEDPSHYAPGTIERMLNSFGQAVLDDPELTAKVNAAVTDVALYLVGRYQDEVGTLISGTVSAWDPQVTSRRIELAIGKDLQFIRINGTLVGGLAGLVIWGMGKLL